MNTIKQINLQSSYIGSEKELMQAILPSNVSVIIDIFFMVN